MARPTYTLQRAKRNDKNDWWQRSSFATAEIGRIDNFRDESGPIRPVATFRGVYDDDAIMLRYEVDGVAACAEPREFNGKVYRDSCCEIFIQPPRPFGGYMNFEVNAGGVLHNSHILDPTRIPGGFKNFRYVRPEHGAQVEIRRWRGTGPATPPCGEVVPDNTTTWGVAMRIPFRLLRSYVGTWSEGEPWRANFYICQADHVARYFASWSRVEIFNFHTPQFFGNLQFGE